VVESVLQKQGAKWGDSGRAGADHKPIGALRMKFSQHRRSWRFERIPFPVFEVKKEIPVLYWLSKAAMSMLIDVKARLLGRPRARIPWDHREAFTLQGRIPILYAYRDDTRSTPLTYGAHRIDENCAQIASGKFGHYGKIDQWLYDALERYPLVGKRVAIIGSTEQGYGPWYECICLHFQAQPTTIEYNQIQFTDKRIQFLQAPVDTTRLEPFDAALSISSFEHDGLGRYGDPLDSEGDVKAMALMRQIIKPGGLLYLSVPLGKDKVIFNLHRIYGQVRLPLLLQGWKKVDSFGFEKSLLDRDTGYGWNPTQFVQTARGVKEELIHPDYPEYGPIFVLQNEA
jgi:hypothetical protein